MSINVSTISGRITKDLELKTTPNGISVTSFTLAVKGYGEKVDFIDVVAWKKLAEIICKECEKGQVLTVLGRISTRTYQDKKNVTHKVTEIFADQIVFGVKAKLSPSNTVTKNYDEQFTEPAYEDFPLEEDLPFE